MNSPLVSVITPTYNHSAVIAECIESVLKQTYSNWELIIVDDGSTDGTRDVVRRFSDPRIRLLAQENKGVWRLSETYNAALEVARGDIVALLEGDDFWPEEKLAVQVPDFDDEEVVLSSGFTAIFQEGRVQGRTPARLPEAEYALNRPVGRAALFLMQPDNLTFTFPVSTVLRASALRRIGGFQQPSYLPLVDLPTFLRLSVEGEFRFHDQVLGYWRRHGASVTQHNLSSILENAYRYAFEFLSRHRDKVSATDQELDELERAWDELACMRCVLRGRLLASQKQWSLASKAFSEALQFRHSAKTRAIVCAARLMCTLRMPVEEIYGKLSGVDLEPAITLSTGDRTVSPGDMDRPRVVGRWRLPPTA